MRELLRNVPMRVEICEILKYESLLGIDKYLGDKANERNLVI